MTTVYDYKEKVSRYIFDHINHQDVVTNLFPLNMCSKLQ